jgi:chromosome partitioning protein
VPSAQQAINEVNEDMEMIVRAVGPVPGYSQTRFAGAIAMMVREWGGILISSMRPQYRRLAASGGIFENYVTEGDGLRQAASARSPVYNMEGLNAERQKAQFMAITQEFMNRCPANQ